MSQPADFHFKLLVGDLAAQIAILRAEVEKLREQLATAAPDDTLPRAEVRPFPEHDLSSG